MGPYGMLLHGQQRMGNTKPTISTNHLWESLQISRQVVALPILRGGAAPFPPLRGSPGA